jgi:hypothetical protein
MKAVWKLLSLPLRQMPLATWLLVVCYVASLTAMVVDGRLPWLLLAALVIWFWHILAGTALRSAVRGDARMLPYFQRRLGQAGLLDLALTVVLTTLVALTTIAPVASHAALVCSGLLLIAALGLAMGTGIRALMLVWLGLIAAGWFPQFLKRVLQSAQQSMLTPVALLLLAGLLVYLALRPLLKLDDREISESPLGTALGGTPSRSGTRVPGRPRTRWSRLFSGVLNSQAERYLHKALHRYQRKPSERHRIALVRAVLLPHDSPQAVLMQFAIMVLFAAVYFFATHAASRWQVAYVGAYAVIIGTTRFTTVGRGLVRMRANLAELYMTLAPVTRAEFQAVLVNSLTWLVGESLFYCLGFGLLVDLLMHAHQPLRLLLAVGISGLSAAMFAFAAYLVGPESSSGQMIMRLVLMVFYVALYSLAYWLIGRLGLELGAALAVLLIVPFGFGTWWSARREFLRRTPRFDVPL